ncbi:unnamed protein product [Ambrosiozyma monospora]|uniref:Unnamed protein product n=1 Tax=Ambrosiozyma monospora TaxID=43982 RepID=A0ACB5STU1_AMBMO|nr:unnamed protein product [Ambrosiozyma monospora]
MQLRSSTQLTSPLKRSKPIQIVIDSDSDSHSDSDVVELPTPMPTPSHHRVKRARLSNPRSSSPLKRSRPIQIVLDSDSDSDVEELPTPMPTPSHHRVKRARLSNPRSNTTTNTKSSPRKSRKSNSVLQPINKLDILSPPTTPKKRSSKQFGLSKVAKKLDFSDAEDDTNESTSSDESVSGSSNTPISPYTAAKNLFLRGTDAKSLSKNCNYILPGRESEFNKLNTFITTTLSNNTSSSIYISGPPGSGKTAQVNALLDSMMVQNIENTTTKRITKNKTKNKAKSKSNSKSKSKTEKPGSGPITHTITLGTTDEQELQLNISVAKINCMTLSKPQDVFTAIFKQVYGTAPDPGSTLEDIRKSLENCPNTDSIILVLDELDNIVTKSQQTLFELFSWASTLTDSNNERTTQLMLIGIANALDLTDRFLPRLRSNRISPELIQFLPYTADQIKTVITTKLNSLRQDPRFASPSDTTTCPKSSMFPPIAHPAAIQLCAKKSAVNTGDLRKAFDIMHRAIELTEAQALDLS